MWTKLQPDSHTSQPTLCRELQHAGLCADLYVLFKHYVYNHQHSFQSFNQGCVLFPGPCTPAGVFVSQACLSNSVMVAWQPSNGTEYYTAAVQTENGVSKVCTTNTSACTVHALTCGQNYSMSVTASNKQCNVTSGQTKSVQSGKQMYPVKCIPSKN